MPFAFRVAVLAALLACVACGTPLPLTGVASQSSTYSDPTSFGPGFALDGNTDNLRYEHVGKIQHTDIGLHEWWRVMFGGLYALDAVTIWNRMDAPAIAVPRINPFSVFLLDASGNKIAHPYSNQSFGMNQTTWTGLLGGATAAGLQVELDGTNYLHMAQVEVFGAQVPEPGTLATMGCGGAALLLAFRRRVRK